MVGSRSAQLRAVGMTLVLGLTLASTPAGAAPTVVGVQTVTPARSHVLDVAAGPDGTVHVLTLVGAGSTSGGGLAVARRLPGQGWEPPAEIASSAEWTSDESLPHMVVDDEGNLAVIYRTSHVHVVQRPARGGWLQPVRVSAATDGARSRNPRLAVDAEGTLTAVWDFDDDSSSLWTVHTASRRRRQDWTAPLPISPGWTGLLHPDVAAGPAGSAVAVWHVIGRPFARTMTNGVWEATATELATTATNGTATVTMDRNGHATAAWGDGNGQFHSRNRPAGGLWSLQQAITGTASSRLRLAAGAGGVVGAAWTRNVGGVVVAEGTTRSTAGSWQHPPQPLSGNAGASHPSVAVNGRGDVVASWIQEGSPTALRAARRPAGASGWDPSFDVSPASHNAFLLEGARLSPRTVSVDPRGDGVFGWSRWSVALAITTIRAYVGGFDVAGPAARLSSPSAVWSLGSVPAAWSATDVWSPIASYRVRYRAAAPSTVFGSPVVWVASTSATSKAFAGKPGTTYCFSARATDAVGNTGAFSGERCTALPLNDRALTASAGWMRAKVAGAYKGTVTTVARKGAVLRSGRVSAKRVALVATRLRGGGTVDVYLGKQRLKQVVLRATKTKRKQVISVASFASRRAGVIRIVTRNARRVTIEGLGISAR